MTRVTTFTNRNGDFAVKDVVCFVVFNPDGSPIFSTCRRKMKAACMAFEEMQDRHWDQIAADGFRVMKLFASGYDRTDQSLISIEQWVVEVGGFEPSDPLLDGEAA